MVLNLWISVTATLALALVTKLCESRGGRPGLPVPTSPYCFCGRKATFEEEEEEVRSCVKVEVVALGHRFLTASPHGLWT